jgi:2-keto-4-pentenoate hydratase/2-oxohepta-3-ene-1,7-dioic acid hydratase in catechol pathway
VKIVMLDSGTGARTGALVDDVVIDLHTADSTIPERLDALIETGRPGLDRVRAALERWMSLPDIAVIPLSSARLLAPWPGRRIAMVGGNHGPHIHGALRGSGSTATVEEVTRRIRDEGPWGFWKTLAWVSNPGDDLVYPRRSRHLDYEAEVAVVIGRRAKDISARDIEQHIWGVTLLNDWSDRDVASPPRPMSYNLMKNFDGSVTVGPCIVVDELDPQAIDVATHVNGDLRQSFNTAEMVFSYGESIEALSRDLTLVPGDMLSGGTGLGTAIDIVGSANKNSPEAERTFLSPGDVVEVSSPQIGTFANRVVAPEPAPV